MKSRSIKKLIIAGCLSLLIQQPGLSIGLPSLPNGSSLLPGRLPNGCQPYDGSGIQNCNIQLSQKNFLSQATSELQNKFPLDIFGNIPNSPVNQCPKVRFFGQETELCIINSIVNGLKNVGLLTFLIRAIVGL